MFFGAIPVAQHTTNDMRRQTHTLVVIFICVLGLFFGACQKEGNVVSVYKDQYTIQDQQRIGAKISEILQQEVGILDTGAHALAYSYLKSLLNTLVNTPNVNRRGRYDWNIYILREPKESHLIGLPGGDLFVSRGLLKHVQSEYQLIALLAHELYYIDTDAGINRLNEKWSNQVLGDILLEKDEPELNDLVRNIEELDYARETVRQADDYYLDLLCPFQYDANGIGSLIHRIDSLDISLEWFVVRPSDLQEREITLGQRAASCGEDGIQNEARYQQFLESVIPQ